MEEEASEKDLSTEFLSSSITTITKIMDQFVDNDPDWERNSKVR